MKIKYVGSGEEGLDLGGVQKEFFQLIISQIFDPFKGLFVQHETGHMMWLNSETIEEVCEFELVGILLGLALYNSVQLDLKFPPALYVLSKSLGDHFVL